MLSSFSPFTAVLVHIHVLRILSKDVIFCHKKFCFIAGLWQYNAAYTILLILLLFVSLFSVIIFQINHNLFSASPVGLHASPGGTTLTHATEQPTQPPNIMHYSCEQQLQYCTVLSKPSTPAAASSGPSESTKGSKKEKPAAKSQTPDVVKCTVPKFYNVRPVAVMDESQPQPEIDEEVELIMLHTLYVVGRVLIAQFNDCILAQSGQIANLTIANDPVPCNRICSSYTLQFF